MGLVPHQEEEGQRACTQGKTIDGIGEQYVLSMISSGMSTARATDGTVSAA